MNRLKKQVGLHNPVLFSKILTCKSTTFDLTECASGVCLCVRGRGWIGIFFLPESPWHIKESELGELKQSMLWEQFENREWTQSLLFYGVMGRWSPQEGKSVKNIPFSMEGLWKKRKRMVTFQSSFNPLIPMSDQNRISPYNVNAKSRRQVMRTKKSIK